MARSKWTEPSLFEAETVPYDQLRARFDVWLDGPGAHVVIHQTLYDHLGTMIAYTGGHRASLDDAGRVEVHRVLDELLDGALRRLSPF